MITKFESFEPFVKHPDNVEKCLSCKPNISYVYLMKDGKVKKVYHKDEYDFQLIKKFFPNNPDVFPTVFDLTDNSITTEYLETEKARLEFIKLNKYLRNKYNIGLLGFLRGNLNRWLNKKTFEPEFDNKEMSIVYSKFKKLIDKIEKITELNLLDIHSRNFGYDEKGNLKMLDL